MPCLRIKVRHSIHCKKWRIKSKWNSKFRQFLIKTLIEKKMQETSHLQSQNEDFPAMLSLKNTPHSTEDSLHG